MKPVLIILFMISSIAHSRCVCTATMGKNFYFERRAPNKIKCKDMLMSANLQAYQQGEICQANQKTFNLKWGCFEKNDKLYGRGTTDMKGGLAAMIVALKALINSDKKKPLFNSMYLLKKLKILRSIIFNSELRRCFVSEFIFDKA